MAIVIDQKKKLWLLSLLVLVLVLGYFTLRYLPKHREIGLLAQQLAADKNELANPRYPEPPDEDAEDLQEQADALSSELLSLETAMKAQLDGLSGANDQDMVLKVSEIARANNVKITENVPFTVAKAQATTAKNTTNNPSPAGPTNKAERKRMRKANRAAQQSAGGIQSVQGEPEGTLIYQLVNDFSEPRPMHAMTLEGGFFDLKSFLQALSSMPAQVTVVRMDVTTKADVAVQGMPQILQVKMIVAM